MSKSEPHARIPAAVISRLIELSKTEIIVLSYLYQCRNKENEAHPSKSTVARCTGLYLPQVSAAYKGLTARGWVLPIKGHQVKLTVPVFRGRPSLPFSPKKQTKKVNESITCEVNESITPPPPKTAVSEPPKVNDSITQLNESISEVNDSLSKKDSTYIYSSLTNQEQTNNRVKLHSSVVAKNTKAKSDRISDDIKAVFVYWQKTLDHPQSKLTKDREAKIRARLKEGYTVGDLLRAIDGCKNSSHHMGENDAGVKYDDIELICRKATFTDRFISYNDRKVNQHGTNSSNNRKERTDADVLRDSADYIASKYSNG